MLMPAVRQVGLDLFVQRVDLFVARNGGPRRHRILVDKGIKRRLEQRQRECGQFRQFQLQL